MKVRWNSEELVPLDIGDNDTLDYVTELYKADGVQLTIKRTQFSRSGETWLFINGKSASPARVTDPLIIGKYAMRVYSYELDEIPSHQIAILSHELKGKSLRIKVDAA